PGNTFSLQVSKKYSEIEELYQRLAAQYPQVSLPLLPRKVLFVGESDISERRAMFNDIMKFISKDKDLATSPELLEFLGTKSSSAVDFKGKNVPDDREKDEENEALDFFKEEKTPDLISQLLSVENVKKEEKKKEGDEEEEEILDPLGVIRTKKVKKAPAPPAKEEKPKLTIFEEDVDPDEGLFGPEKDFSSVGPRRKMKENLKLFEDPDLGGVVRLGDSLLLPAACEHSNYVLSRAPEEDTEELLRVEDSFEKLLEVTSKPKPKVPPSIPLPQKPAVAPRSANSPSLAKQKENRIQTMNEVDILQYIQENESINNQDTSLF
ncbi:H1BP3 protein, partial [Lanius ludovicianus]|nr:H1BP3 protein [Lanius ludovicianus]